MTMYCNPELVVETPSLTLLLYKKAIAFLLFISCLEAHPATRKIIVIVTTILWISLVDISIFPPLNEQIIYKKTELHFTKTTLLSIRITSFVMQDIRDDLYCMLCVHFSYIIIFKNSHFI